MAKKSLIETSIKTNNAGCIIAVDGAGQIDINVADLSADVASRALIHGLIQKISDAAAIKKDELTGNPTTDAATKFAAMQAVANRLLDGDWSARSGDGSGPVSGVIYLAFERWALAKAAKAKKAMTPAEVRAIYDGKDRSGQLALRNVPEIATIIEEIKAERGAAKTPVNVDNLLWELGL